MSDERPDQCPHCGAETREKGIYCGECGGQLIDTPASQSTASSATTTWTCLHCGAGYDEYNPPCKQCASERLARLEDDATIDSAVDITWRCTQCGATAPRNNPPCKECGGMQFKRVGESTEATVESDGGLAKARSYVEPSGRATFFNPRGPFRPARRWLWRLTLLSIPVSFVLLVVGFSAGLGDLIVLTIYYDVVIFPWVVLALLVFWFIDTVLSYLKG